MTVHAGRLVRSCNILVYPALARAMGSLPARASGTVGMQLYPRRGERDGARIIV